MKNLFFLILVFGFSNKILSQTKPSNEEVNFNKTLLQIDSLNTEFNKILTESKKGFVKMNKLENEIDSILYKKNCRTKKR